MIFNIVDLLKMFHDTTHGVDMSVFPVRLGLSEIG